MRGNVLMNGNRAAIGHWPAADGKGSAILKLIDEVAGIGTECLFHPVLYILLRIARATSGFYARVEDLRQRRPRFDFSRVEAIHRTVKIIRQNKPFVGAKH